MTHQGIDPLHGLILEAGRAIRPYLGDLAGQDCHRIDQCLSEILNREDLSGAEKAILDQLDGLRATHNWLSAFWRAGGIPPEVVRLLLPNLDRRMAEQRVRIAILGGGVTAGDPVLTLPGRRYVCRFGDCVWYREDAAEEVPMCPTHKLLLAPETPTAARES